MAAGTELVERDYGPPALALGGAGDGAVEVPFDAVGGADDS
jgi:hypothetical protein